VRYENSLSPTLRWYEDRHMSYILTIYITYCHVDTYRLKKTIAHFLITIIIAILEMMDIPDTYVSIIYINLHFCLFAYMDIYFIFI
jgi:Na+/H+ antiporter NhaD/arsenite permease-like protein